jgi:hypothetical protein
MPLLVLQLEPAMKNVGVEADLVKLSQRDDAAVELGEEVDFEQGHVLPTLAVEEDRVASLDLHGGVVTELDEAVHARVEFGEELAPATHVVTGT